MRNAVIGLIIGIVAGIVLGTTVIAPRIAHHQSNGLGLALEKPEKSATEAEAKKEQSPETDADVTRLRMASAFPDTLPAFGTLAKRMEHVVWRTTDGTLDIRFHSPGALVPDTDALAAVRSGTIDAYFTSLGILSGGNPDLGFFAGPPFGASLEAYLAWMQKGGGYQLLVETMAEQGLHPTLCGLIPQAGGGWFKTPLKTVEDFKGLRVRVPPTLAGLYEDLGASVVTLPLVDTAAGFDAGDLDGAVLSAPHVDVAVGAPRGGFTYYLPDIRVPADVHVFLMSSEGWAELSPVQQTQIQTVCGDNTRHAIAESEASQYEALKQITKAGTDVQPWPAEIAAAMRGAWTERAKALAEANDAFKSAKASYESFVKEQSIWEELARP